MEEQKSSPSIPARIDEVRGVFSNSAELEVAIEQLTQAGFDRADLSLPIFADDPSKATPEQASAAPVTDTDRRQARTLGTSMAGTVGAIAAAGVTVATGGVAAAAVAAAIAGGAGAGALAGMAGQGVASADRAMRDEAALRGELVLSVRASDAERQQRAERIMREAGAYQARSISRTRESMEDATDSASWTG